MKAKFMNTNYNNINEVSEGFTKIKYNPYLYTPKMVRNENPPWKNNNWTYYPSFETNILLTWMKYGFQPKDCIVMPSLMT